MVLFSGIKVAINRHFSTVDKLCFLDEKKNHLKSTSNRHRQYCVLRNHFMALSVMIACTALISALMTVYYVSTDADAYSIV